ncbi:MAG TPA: hypothetical protein VNN79_11900 [Actinomycetota bacterium]|nr:hypothetical protein [Actinomycetota bacterium]
MRRTPLILVGGLFCAASLTTPSNALTTPALAVPAIPANVHGGSGGHWTTSGPPGGLIGPIAVDPSRQGVVYAGASEGLFRSTDEGATWRQIGFEEFPVVALAVDPLRPRILFAADFALERSTDGGRTWRTVLDDIDVNDVVIDPLDSRFVVVVGTGGFSRNGVLFGSADGGTTWHDLTGGLPRNTRPESVALDAAHPGRLYLGTEAHGLFVSQDRGATWRRVDFGLGGRLTVRDVAVDVTGFPHVWATVPAFSGHAPGVYRGSPNGGFSRVLPGDMRALGVDIENGIVFADPVGRPIMRSFDRGETWQPAGPSYGNRDAFTIAFDPRNANVFASGLDLLESTDLGTTWAVTEDGLTPGREVGALAVDPGEPDVVLAGTTSGVFRSADGGALWSRSSDGLPPREVTAIAFDPAQPGVAFAGVDVRAGFAAKSLYRSEDDGASWSAVPSAFPRRALVNALVFDPTNAARVYAATSAGVLRSRDGGLHWDVRTDRSTAGATDVAVDAGDPRRVWATTSFGGVFLSDRSGRRWSRVTGAPEADRVEADPSRPGVLYLGRSAGEFRTPGLYRSTNGGVDWTKVFGFAVFTLRIDPAHPATIYAGEFDLFESTDDGATFDPMPPLPVQANLDDLALSSDGTQLHAGTGSGAFEFHPGP